MSGYLELEDKRALVTGGTKGVGASVVAALREAGARVLTTARKPPEGVSEAEFVAADVSTAEGCAAVADAVRKRLGGLDILVHVVGGASAPAGGFAVLDDGEWHHRLAQRRDADAFQHCQQRTLYREDDGVVCRGSLVHPGAALPLLWYGLGRVVLHGGRREHGVSQRGIRRRSDTGCDSTSQMHGIVRRSIDVYCSA
jgi:short chain dehydrogenase